MADAGKSLSPSGRIATAADFLRSRLDGRQPEVGIILGRGRGNLAEKIADQIVIPYVEVPGFPAATAIGHKGNFISGVLGGRQVLAMQGRYHYYEGYGMEVVVLPVRVMAALGVKYLFASNAVGTMNPEYSIGDLVLIRDHINMIPNSLIGHNLESLGPRFPDMTCAYDLELQDKMVAIAAREGIAIQRGVYVSTSGPCYETPAEYKFFRAIGADTVGMSVTPEVIAARHAGLRVLGMSVVTDVAHEVGDDYVTDENEIVRQADAAAHRMERLFSCLLEEL